MVHVRTCYNVIISLETVGIKSARKVALLLVLFSTLHTWGDVLLSWWNDLRSSARAASLWHLQTVRLTSFWLKRHRPDCPRAFNPLRTPGCSVLETTLAVLVLCGSQADFKVIWQRVARRFVFKHESTKHVQIEVWRRRMQVSRGFHLRIGASELNMMDNVFFKTKL